MKKKRVKRKRRRDITSQTQAGPRRRVVAIGVLGCIIVALAGVYFLGGRGGGKRIIPPADAATHPNVLLITLDTTRADHVGCYGYAAAETPAIDGLAGSGVRFERAYTHVPLTLPAHTSLLTGLYPVSTGVHINGTVALGPEVGTLATDFKERGYRTGAFIGSSVLDSAFGLARGFDVYDDEMHGAEMENDQAQRGADAVCDAALHWLQATPGTAFFAWVHFYDPHTPYEPPAEFASKFADPYDGEIAFVDSQVGRLLRWLDEAGMRDQTLVIAVGDHGEALHEHREAEHGYFIYDATMHVPLVFSFPAGFAEPREVETPVGLADVVPTVFDLLGRPVPGDLDGRSLLPECRGTVRPMEPIYGESQYPLLSFGWAPLRSYRDGQWKLIDAPKVELYDLNSDPGELTNVADSHSDQVVKLQRDLEEMIAGMHKREGAAVAASASALERLASLGYVAGSSHAPAESAEGLRDPKDMFGIFEGFTRALGMLGDGQFAGAAAIVEQATEISPESDEMFAVLGTAYLKLDRPADAQKAFETSLRRSGDSPRHLSGLGEALRRQNKLKDAQVCFEEALKLAPNWGPAHRGLAAIFSQQKQLEEAEPHWRSCVEESPGNVNCLVNLGSALMSLQRPSEALTMLDRALKEEPSNEFAYQVLWRSLVALGRKPEAIERLNAAISTYASAAPLTCPLARLMATTAGTKPELLEQATGWAQACCQAQPGNAIFFDTLAAVWAARGDFDRAVRTARQALSLAQAGGQGDLARQIQMRLQLYQAGSPFVD